LLLLIAPAPAPAPALVITFGIILVAAPAAVAALAAVTAPASGIALTATSIGAPAAATASATATATATTLATTTATATAATTMIVRCITLGDDDLIDLAKTVFEILVIEFLNRKLHVVLLDKVKNTNALLHIRKSKVASLSEVIFQILPAGPFGQIVDLDGPLRSRRWRTSFPKTAVTAAVTSPSFAPAAVTATVTRELNS
jgi:hypothetical protein